MKRQKILTKLKIEKYREHNNNKSHIHKQIINNMNRRSILLTSLTALAMATCSIVISGCTKEGPAGKDGKDGQDGKDGKDGTAACISCHAPDGIELAATQYDYSKHAFGEQAYARSGIPGCSPCHASEAFKYICLNNVPATFTLNSATGRYATDFVVPQSVAYGDITCSTCHSSIHATYGPGDLALTTIAPVDLNMWGGKKTIDIKADGGRSNLCIKCHQPQPITQATDGNVLNYEALAANPGGIIFSPESSNNLIIPQYRTHPHYGTTGAIFAGVGGVEFPGVAYENSVHTRATSCQDCHMAPMQGKSGGHTFFSKGNFNGCNASGCHTGVTANSDGYWKTPRANVKAALDALAAKLNIGGIDVLNRNPDASHNLWAANSTNRYDGYLNIYDPVNNPSGVADNPGGIFQNPAPAASWTQAQKDFNATLPKLTLTNAQMGAIINFQLCLRDFSLGIHNYKYTMALLNNSINALN